MSELPCYYSGHDWEQVEQGDSCRKCGRFVPDESGFGTIRDRERQASCDHEWTFSTRDIPPSYRRCGKCGYSEPAPGAMARSLTP